jgi:hypothetical protein
MGSKQETQSPINVAKSDPQRRDYLEEGGIGIVPSDIPRQPTEAVRGGRGHIRPWVLSLLSIHNTGKRLYPNLGEGGMVVYL